MKTFSKNSSSHNEINCHLPLESRLGSQLKLSAPIVPSDVDTVQRGLTDTRFLGHNRDDRIVSAQIGVDDGNAVAKICNKRRAETRLAHDSDAERFMYLSFLCGRTPVLGRHVSALAIHVRTVHLPTRMIVSRAENPFHLFWNTLRIY